MTKKLQYLVWLKNCVLRAITRRDARYLRLARSHLRGLLSL